MTGTPSQRNALALQKASASGGRTTGAGWTVHTYRKAPEVDYLPLRAELTGPSPSPHINGVGRA